MQLFIDMIKTSGFLAGVQASNGGNDRFEQRLTMIGKSGSLTAQRAQLFKRQQKLRAA